MRRKIIDGKYYAISKNPDISALTQAYNIRFAREKVTSFTSLDALALKWWGNEKFWPIICYFNSIVDPLTELDTKQELIIPLDIQNWIEKIDL